MVQECEEILLHGFIQPLLLHLLILVGLADLLFFPW